MNVDRSFDIQDRLLKTPVGIIDMLMEETMSQILFLGPKLKVKTNFRKCFLT